MVCCRGVVSYSWCHSLYRQRLPVWSLMPCSRLTNSLSAQRVQGQAIRHLSVGLSSWTTKPPALRKRAAGLSAETATEAPGLQDGQDAPSHASEKPAARATGAFQTIPMVPSADEHLASALRRARRITPNARLKNEAAKARNKAARQMDELVTAISAPLGACVKGFPAAERLHPFERALLDLTFGPDVYQRRLARLTALRQSAVEVGKAYAARAARAGSKHEAEALAEEGTVRVAAVYSKGAGAVDGLKDMAKQLRRLPVVDLGLPTVALVGAPNVGKSSLVQALSSGQPQVCDYPFTTRSVKMGHFYVDGRRHQVTDTPGLLNRIDEERNAMERLTLACMAHLPTSILFIMDLTGECGTSVAAQWAIRADLRAKFACKPWLDVFTKQDLLRTVRSAAADAPVGEAEHAQPAGEDAAAPDTEDAPGDADERDMQPSSEDAAPFFEVGRAAELQGVLQAEGEQGGSAEQVRDAAQQTVSSSDGQSGEGAGAAESRRSFSWGKQTGGLQTPVQVARALPEAVWVSSVTDEGMLDLKAAVLRMLQSRKSEHD